MRKQLIIIFSLVIIIPVLLLGFLANRTSVDLMTEQLTENTNSLTIEMAEGLDTYFKGFNNGLVMLSENIDAKEILNQPEYEAFLMGIFENYLIGHEDVRSAYLGTKNGDMFIRPAQDLPSDYDPRIRPWYERAKDSSTPIWTDPYSDASTEDMLVTAAIPVYDNNDSFVGVIGLDIDITQLSNSLSTKEIGADGYAFLLDSNNNTLTHPDESLIGSPPPVEAIATAVESMDASGVFYDYNGSEKYVYFKTLQTTGWKLMGVQSSVEIENAKASMQQSILMISVASIFVAFIVAFVYTKYPTENMKKIISEMEAVKSGNLTTSLDLKTKTEIGDIGNNFNSMVSTLATLVNNIKGVVRNVEEEAENLAATSQETSASATEVGRAVEEIAQGATEQANDTDRAVTLTNKLDEQFTTLLENTNQMLESANRISTDKEIGIKSIKELQEKTKENNTSTREIGNAIDGLNVKSEDIENIIETISSIAEQTNLLALNASIEAARAGEHGKGFAVVADEIRKLAEESSNSAEEISKIVQDIQKETKRTVTIMDDVTKRSKAQTESVEKVNASFNDISISIEEIGELIHKTGDFIDMMNDNKSEILASIENISAVSEESAASAEEVTASMDQQNIAIEDVAKAAENLSHLASKLNKEVSKFKL